ncbi:hypothetical protein BDV97DRAFT_341221 [Delphinella strobiligena]|nr:hypothetical protein BDV97DRAFT_341221 [Delphinella strobiligena]
MNRFKPTTRCYGTFRDLINSRASMMTLGVAPDKRFKQSVHPVPSHLIYPSNPSNPFHTICPSNSSNLFHTIRPYNPFHTIYPSNLY